MTEDVRDVFYCPSCEVYFNDGPDVKMKLADFPKKKCEECEKDDLV